MNDQNILELKPYSVTISVVDITETSHWYQEKLGFKQIKTKNYPEFGTRLAFLELNSYRVELIEDKNSKPGLKLPEPPGHTVFQGISQFCFEVADLEKTKKILLSKDVPIIWAFENAELGAKFLFIRDPNGNLIQFLQQI